jgi:hypothetical protein
MNIPQTRPGLAMALALCLAAPGAYAAHADIEVEISPPQDPAGLLIVDPHNEIPVANWVKPGRKVFEAEVGELGKPFKTDDPGFDIDDGNGIPGSVLAFEVMGTLMKWDGLTWASSGFDEYLEITDVLDAVTIVTATAGTGLTGLIDAFDAGGGIHTHIDFEVASDAGTPEDGAYLLELRLFGLDAGLTNMVYGASDPFLIAFHLNQGGTFGDLAFETAVDALIAPIPLPAAAWLLGSAALALGARGRRRAA